MPGQCVARYGPLLRRLRLLCHVAIESELVPFKCQREPLQEPLMVLEVQARLRLDLRARGCTGEALQADVHVWRQSYRVGSLSDELGAFRSLESGRLITGGPVGRGRLWLEVLLDGAEGGGDVAGVG
jgi:hypothetical protein